MARLPGVIALNTPQYIVQSGYYTKAVFIESKDYEYCLKLLYKFKVYSQVKVYSRFVND